MESHSEIWLLTHPLPPPPTTPLAVATTQTETPTRKCLPHPAYRPRSIPPPDTVAHTHAAYLIFPNLPTFTSAPKAL